MCGQEAYVCVADELDPMGATRPITLDELDTEIVASAQEWASLYGLPWPPPVLDVALEMLAIVTSPLWGDVGGES